MSYSENSGFEHFLNAHITGVMNSIKIVDNKISDNPTLIQHNQLINEKYRLNSLLQAYKEILYCFTDFYKIHKQNEPKRKNRNT